METDSTEDCRSQTSAEDWEELDTEFWLADSHTSTKEDTPPLVEDLSSEDDKSDSSAEQRRPRTAGLNAAEVSAQIQVVCFTLVVNLYHNAPVYIWFERPGTLPAHSFFATFIL